MLRRILANRPQAQSDELPCRHSQCTRPAATTLRANHLEVPLCLNHLDVATAEAALHVDNNPGAGERNAMVEILRHIVGDT